MNLCGSADKGRRYGLVGSSEIAGDFAAAQIALTVGLTLIASLVMTVAPARRAARIRPAVALRIAD